MAMNKDDRSYYLGRAEQEQEAASRAVNPRAASIHRTLACRYRAKAVSPFAKLPLRLRNEDLQEFNVIRD